MYCQYHNISNDHFNPPNLQDCPHLDAPHEIQLAPSIGYYLQSHVENAFYRFKRIIGGQLRSKNSKAQEREVLIGCSILNRMLEVGRLMSCQVC